MLTAAIAERNYMTDKRNRDYITWAVHAVGHLTIATSMVESEGRNKISDALEGIKLLTPAEEHFYEAQAPKAAAMDALMASEAFGGNGTMPGPDFSNLPVMDGLLTMPVAGGGIDVEGNGTMVIDAANAPEGPAEMW